MAHIIKLVDKKEVAKDTMAFIFAKPAGYTFIAGQHTDWAEINPPKTDAEGLSRTFCYASAPHEEHLMIATRMRDTAFKNVLKEAPVGFEIEMGEPRGKLVLPETADRPLVFLAGGIGITPFRCLILDATAKKLPHQITLVYSNNTPEDAAFLDELKNIENPNYHFVPIFTKQSGFITKEFLSQSLTGIESPIYFVVGPPQFELAMRDILTSSGVDDLSIKSEGFDGY